MENHTVCARAGLLALSSFAFAYLYQVAWAWRHGMEGFRSQVLITWLVAALIMGMVGLLDKRKGSLPVPLTSIWIGMSLFALCGYFGTGFERNLALVIGVLCACVYLLSARACRQWRARAVLVAATTIVLGLYLASQPMVPKVLELDIQGSPSANRFWAFPVDGGNIDYQHPTVADVPQIDDELTVALRLRRDSAEYGIRFGGSANAVTVRRARLSLPLLLWQSSVVEYTADQLAAYVSPPNPQVTTMRVADDLLSLQPGAPPNPAWLIVSVQRMRPSPAENHAVVKVLVLLGFVLLASLIAWRSQVAAGLRHIFAGAGETTRPAVAAAWILIAGGLYLGYRLHPWYGYSIALVLIAMWWRRLRPIDRLPSTAGATPLPADRRRWWPAVLLAASALVIVLRAPEILHVPRFWAEDAIHYYYHAATMDAWSTFLYQHEYKLIISSFAALLSRFFALEWAPLPFTWIALVVQLAAVAVVIYGNSPLWDSVPKKALAAAIIIFAPSSEEIWLNANGTQYYSALITALLLCDDPQRYRFAHRHTVRLGLILCGLNGVLSSALAPLFWLRWMRERDRERLVQALILSSAGVIQLILVLTVDNPSGRTDLPSVGTLGWIFAIKGILQPLQLDWALALFQVSAHDVEVSRGGHLEAVGYGLLFASLVAVGAAARFLRCADGLYLVLSLFILTLVVSLFGLGGEGNRTFTAPLAGNRYFYTSSALLLLTVFACVRQWRAAQRASVATVAASGLLLMGMVNSAVIFYSVTANDPTWARWQEEVALWRHDPSHMLRIWPARWVLGLPPEVAH